MKTIRCGSPSLRRLGSEFICLHVQAVRCTKKDLRRFRRNQCATREKFPTVTLRRSSRRDANLFSIHARRMNSRKILVPATITTVRLSQAILKCFAIMSMRFVRTNPFCSWIRSCRFMIKIVLPTVSMKSLANISA